MPTEKPDNWDDLEDGTRADAQVSQDVERHYFVVDGKRYWFDVAEPTWKKRNEIMSSALSISDDGADLAIDEYYLDILEHMIEGMSVEGDNVRMFLVGVGSELGEKLQQLAPDPGETLGEGEEGKSDEHFGEATQDSAQTQA